MHVSCAEMAQGATRALRDSEEKDAVLRGGAGRRFFTWFQLTCDLKQRLLDVGERTVGTKQRRPSRRGEVIC